MITDAKTCGFNIRQENYMPKLIMNHGIHLYLFTERFVNYVRIENYYYMDPKKKIPPPLVLTHPVVKLVHIPNLITEFNQVHVMIV